MDHTIQLPYSIQDELLQKRFCTTCDECFFTEPDDPECRISLRDIIDQFKVLDTYQALLNSFEDEILEKLTQEEQIAVTFVIKEA